MVSNLIRPIDPIRPIVTAQYVGCSAESCQARITEASPAENLGLFRVTVLADGATVIPATELAAGTDISGGGLTLRYTDLGGEGKVTGGDTMRLGGVSSNVSYEIVLLWNDGAALQTIELST